jgi:hypothetical protein
LRVQFWQSLRVSLLLVWHSASSNVTILISHFRSDSSCFDLCVLFSDLRCKNCTHDSNSSTSTLHKWYEHVIFSWWRMKVTSSTISISYERWISLLRSFGRRCCSQFLPLRWVDDERVDDWPLHEVPPNCELVIITFTSLTILWVTKSTTYPMTVSLFISLLT